MPVRTVPVALVLLALAACQGESPLSPRLQSSTMSARRAPQPRPSVSDTIYTCLPVPPGPIDFLHAR